MSRVGEARLHSSIRLHSVQTYKFIVLHVYMSAVKYNINLHNDNTKCMATHLGFLVNLVAV